MLIFACVFLQIILIEHLRCSFEAQMENWKTNLAMMAAKERQYMQQSANHKVLLVSFLMFIIVKSHSSFKKVNRNLLVCITSVYD